KLHGSLNWTRCGHCGRIGVFTFPRYFEVFKKTEPTFKTSENYRLEVGQHLTAFTHCPNTPPPHTAEPLIVPPTWSKTGHYEQIAVVWQRAAKHLSEARNIIVVGYSLPRTDEFFRYLYALGTVSQTRLQQFIVVNNDRTEKVKRRFRNLLGPLAQRRFDYQRSTFHDAVDLIAGNVT